jgi:hypothetical protein
MKTIKVVAVATVLSVLGSLLSAETLSCTLKDNRNSGWLPEQLVVQIHKDRSVAEVYDPITFSTLDRFVQARLQALNSVRIELQWETGRYRNDKAMLSRDMPDASAVKIVFRATILRGGNKILLRAQPGSSQTRYNAQGACKVLEAGIGEVVRR